MTRTKKISVTEADLQPYPHVLKLFRSNPRVSAEFVSDMINRLWSGRADEALKMMEEYLKNGGEL